MIMNNKKIKNIIIISLFASLVLVFSKIEFRVVETRIHLGNSFCLLSGFILSPLSAGLSAGIGSLFFDLLFYPSSMPLEFVITFLNKFVMSFVCSYVYHLMLNKNINIKSNIILSGLLGQISYIVLYLLKTYIQRKYIILLSNEVVIAEIILKLGTSSVNAIFAIIISSILYAPAKKAVEMFNEQY